MFNYFDEIIEDVDRGRSGLNIGVPFGKGLESLTNYMCGIQKKTYTLIGGNTGTGKTALVDQMYVLGPLEFLINNPEFHYRLHVDYYTLEISITRKLAKWACWKLLHDDGILLDSKTLFSKSQKNRLSDETYQLYIKKREWIENIQKFVTFREVASPQSIKQNVVNFFSTKGETIQVVEEQEGIKTNVSKFVHNDPSLIFQNVVDHIGLMKKDSGVTDKKANLDNHSANVVGLRNFYGISEVDVSQFNRELGDVSRRRFSELTPQLEDYKDSGNTQEDADVVCSIFEPKRYNLPEYKEYLMAHLEKWFRMFFIIKNRDGGAGVHKALRFFGECGDFEEFESVEVFKANVNLYLETKEKLNNVRRG